MRIQYVVVCGVRIDSIPVLVNFISWTRSRGDSVELLEHKGRYGLLFVLKAVVLAIKHRHSFIIFANTQAAFPLRLLQCLPIRIKKTVYWAFESTLNASKWSPVWLGIWAERLLRHKDVDLIIPIEERRQFFSTNYRSVSVVENVPLLGRGLIERNLRQGERIKLVIYGGLSARLTYTIEVLNLVRNWPLLYELTLIGDVNGFDVKNYECENITFLGRLPHRKLLEILAQNFHYSLVGYKPVMFNYKYCAPNKLYESFSFSLPVIGSVENPTITQVLEDWNGGLLVDFSKLEGNWLYQELVHDYKNKSFCAYSAFINRFNFDCVADHSQCFGL